MCFSVALYNGKKNKHTALEHSKQYLKIKYKKISKKKRLKDFKNISLNLFFFVFFGS
jgi:hypothetical protein